MGFAACLRNLALASLLAMAALPATAQIVVDDAHTDFSTRTGGGVVILMYHGLDPFTGANYNPDSFRAQIQYLKNNGFQTVTLDHLRSWIQTGAPPMPAKPVVLTFDDNYITIYTVAFPALKAAGFVGYNFAHTHYVGVWSKYDHADWLECAEMEADGAILTESHTVMHLHLTTLNATQLANELVNSKAAIEANIPGKTVRHLAYPYGSHNATVIAATIAAGYETAVTTILGVNTRATPLYELRRYGVNPQLGSDTSVGSTFISAANAGLGAAWLSSSAQPGFIGTGYRYTAAGTGGGTATWNFTLTQTGTYQVSARWTTSNNRATNAPYTVTHRNGSSTVRVNQQTNNGVWVPLGQFQFDGGMAYNVTLSDDANGLVIADAIQVSPVSAVADWELY